MTSGYASNMYLINKRPRSNMATQKSVIVDPKIPKKNHKIYIHMMEFFNKKKGKSTVIKHRKRLTLPETNSSPLKIGRIPIGKDAIPTIHFQGQAVSFREGKSFRIPPNFASRLLSSSLEWPETRIPRSRTRLLHWEPDGQGHLVTNWDG